MLISVVGPGTCGRTLISYVLTRELVTNTRFSVLVIDLDPRLKKSCLEVLFSEFRNKHGLYNYDGSSPLPIIPIDNNLFLVPPGVRERKIDINLAKILLEKIIPSSNCDITICDCSIGIEIPFTRYLVAYSDIIINVQTIESYADVFEIVRLVDPKPKIVNIRNLVTRPSKDSRIIEVPFLRELWQNIQKVRKREVYRRVIKKFRPLINTVITYLSTNIEEILKIRRRVILEELLLY